MTAPQMTDEIERVARVIDPDAFDNTIRKDGPERIWAGRREKARAKARAAIAAIRKDDELRDALAFVRESIRNCGATAHIGGTVSWLVPDEVMLKLRSALSSVAGGGG